MTLSRRLLLILFALLGCAFIVLAAGGQYFVRQWVEANLLESAEKVRNILMATRRVYQHQFIDSGLPVDDKTLGFLPAHAMHRISNDLQHWDKSGFTFNNVSDQPRNPFNKADEVEMAAIEHFRANPDTELQFTPFTNAEGKHYYLYARPIRVEKYCLQCHGERDQAPEAIRLHYDEAFGYQEGDLRGILSIKVPATSLEAQAQASLLALLGVGVITLGLLGIGIAWAVGRNVLRPLTVLERHIHDVAGGDLSKRITGLTGEFAQVGEAYNRMAAHLTRERTGRIESESTLTAIFEQAAVGIALTALDGHWLRMNPKACEIFGYSEVELRTMTFQSMTHPEERRDSENDRLAMLSGEVSGISREKRYQRKDGSFVWTYRATSLVRKPDGSPDYFITVIDDITPYKEAQLARQQSDLARINAEHSLLESQTSALEEQREARRAALSLLEDATAARKSAETAEKELRARNEELERFNQAMIGRELDMVELKQRINELSRELGREPPYDLGFLDHTDGGMHGA